MITHSFYIAPYNDIARGSKQYLESYLGGSCIGFLDSFVKQEGVYNPTESSHFTGFVIIVSPNHFRAIHLSLLQNNFEASHIYFYIPIIHFLGKSIAIASFLYRAYPHISKYFSKYKKLQFNQYEKELGSQENTLFLQSLANCHSGKRIFLIGNGPSLQISDLDKLGNEITFAANKIYLSFNQTSWRPTYYLVEDDLVFRQNFNQINSLSGCVKLFPHYARTWGKKVRNSHYFRMHLRSPKDPIFPQFNPDPLNDGLYWGSTVIYTMIEFAVYFGCKEIYLIGVDFNFSVPKAQSYNYAENRVDLICEGEVNHFHKDYRKPGEKWNLPNLDVQLRTFAKAKEYCDIHDIKIYNASRQTKLDTFEKIEFDTLF